MRPRHNLIEIFSTFVQFAEDYFNSWVSDPKLRRSMEKCLRQSPQSPASEQFWVHYWHNLWQNESKMAEGHLFAYLQEICYWIAQKTATTGFAGMHLSIADLFQIALTQTYRILRGYNPDQGSTLKDYAGVSFKSIIRDTLRQRRETDICSDWALLRKISQKRLRESLKNAGVNSESLIEQYVLAWTCFNTLYVPTQATGTRQLAKPDKATWEAIAHLYNQECATLKLFTSESSGNLSASPEQLERWLSQCAKWARLYLYPHITSLNVPQSDQHTDEVLDYLPDVRDSFWVDLIEEEESKVRQTQQVELKQVLDTALSQLKPDLKEILHLYYAQELTQQDIAQQLDIKQYTVSRRLKKARESLLKALSKWKKDTWGGELNSEMIQQINNLLEEWLQNYAWNSQ